MNAGWLRDWLYGGRRRLVARFWPGRLGDEGERLAERHLKKLGYKIVARRHRTPLGELDLIALDGACLVFVEVKARRSCDAGHPVEAVDAAKQAQLARLALAYMKAHHRLEHQARFDVVAVLWAAAGVPPEIVHYRNAFESPGRGRMFG